MYPVDFKSSVSKKKAYTEDLNSQSPLYPSVDVCQTETFECTSDCTIGLP